MEPWLDPRKWEIPPEPRGWQARAGLVAAAGAARLVVLAGGPGAGKTLGLRALTQGTRSAVWLACDADDTDDATWRLDLAGAFARVIPGFAPIPAGDARTTWVEILRRLGELGAPALDLALDDAHHALDAAPDRWRALLDLLPRFPAGFRVLVATATPLTGGLARAEAKGLARALGPTDMAFTPEESIDYLETLAPGTVPPVGLEGWPLGLALAATGAAPDGDMRALVEESWLTDLDAADRAALGRAAALGDLSPDALAAVAGVSDPMATLASWHARFLVVPFGQAGFKLAGPLAPVLAAAFVNQTPEPARKAFHREAAAWYAPRGDAPRAIAHHLTAEDWPAAAAALHDAGPALAASGRLGKVGRWLSEFPGGAIATDPRLRFWTGQVAYFEGRLGDALGEYEAARRGFGEQDATADAIKSALRAMTVAAVADDAKAFNRLAILFQARADEARPEDQADALLLRAMMADRHGDQGLMGELNRAVLAIPAAGNLELAMCHGIAHHNLFTLAWQRGDLAGARAHAEAARERAADRPDIAGSAECLLAHLDLEAGEVAAAGQRLAALGPGWEAALDWYDRALAWTVIGRHAGATGADGRAEAAFARADRLFRHAGAAEGNRVITEARIWHHAARGQAERALAIAAAGPAGPPTHFYDAAQHVATTWAMACHGNTAGALAAWPELIAALDGLGAQYHVAIARAAEAATRQLAGVAVAPPDLTTYPWLAARFGLAAAPTPVAVAPAAAAPAPAPEGVQPLHLQLFGPMRVTVGDREVTDWPRRKAKWILAAIALYPRGLTPWTAAEVLEDPQLVAKNGNLLRVNVGALRRALEPALDKGDESPYIAWSEGAYRFGADTLVTVDMWDFERLADQADALRTGKPAAAIAAYTEALALVTGELLDEPGARERFVAERQRVGARALGAWSFLASQAEAGRDWDEAETHLTRAATFAPAEAEPTLALMAFQVRRKRPDLARRAYWDHRRALKAALGMTPDEEVEEAFAALRD